MAKKKKPQPAPVPQVPAESSKSPAKALRDSAIVSHALSGKSNVAIAREMGIDRETVAKVLNSDDMKELCAEIDGKLAAGVNEAIKVVLDSAKKDLSTAIDLLKNFGSMRSSLKLEHTGKDGAPLGRQLSDEEIDARIRALTGKGKP